MKLPAVILALLVPAVLLADEPEPAKPAVPKGPLSDTEKAFVGKWSGQRFTYRWEINRKADRTFEIAFEEPDPEHPNERFENYATGVWWVDDDGYHFEWLKWAGDEGDFSGLSTEKVDKVEKDRVVTLTEGDDDPRNVETRVKEFVLKAWRFKPKAAPEQ